MYQRVLFFLALAASAMAGCAESRNHPEHDRAKLYAGTKAGEKLLSIIHREWVGLVGPHGFEGHRNIGYWATLAGDGPVFKNPKFQDNSPIEYECIGTITLDREHSRVTIDMRRIVSKPGEPQRTELHPANGTYPIEAIFDKLPGGP